MKDLHKSDLLNFTGTETWYRHSINRKMTYTEGAQFVAEHGGAYWLIDEIAFAQSNKNVSGEEFQHWKLVVSDKSGVLTCDDGNGNIVYTQKLAYTDFPLPSIDFYYCNDVLMLPSEY